MNLVNFRLTLELSYNFVKYVLSNTIGLVTSDCSDLSGGAGLKPLALVLLGGGGGEGEYEAGGGGTGGGGRAGG